MADVRDDFWPSDIGTTDLVTPVSIMREQAALLGEKTNQQITASVQPLAQSPEQFVWSFQLNSPALGNYKFELFRVSHPLTLYPVRVSREGYPVKQSNTQEDFKAILREILGSDQTKRIVHSLLAQIVK